MVKAFDFGFEEEPIKQKSFDFGFEEEPIKQKSFDFGFEEEPQFDFGFEEETEGTVSTSTPGYVPSETEKAKYGFAKEPWIGGSAWRLIQATTGMGVEGDTFAERRENAWNRHMDEVYEKYPWAKGGDFDMDAAVIGGEVSSIMADPLLWIPWIGWGGKVYKTGQVGSKAYQTATTAGKTAAQLKRAAAVGGFSGAVAGADMGLRLLDKDGRIDPKTWATTTGIATAFGGALPLVGAGTSKALEKLLPNYFKGGDKVAEEVLSSSVDEIVKRNAKAGISTETIKEIASNPIIAAGRESLHSAQLRFNQLKQLELSLSDVIKLDKVNTKLDKIISKGGKIKQIIPGEQAAKLRQERLKLQKILNSDKKFEELTDIKLQSDRQIADKLRQQISDEWDSITYSSGKILADIQEELYKKGGAAVFTDRVLKSVAASITYPAFFGLTGGIMGAVSSDDDVTVQNWAMSGAAIGLAYRFGLQRKIIPKQVSDDVFGYQFRNWLNLGMRRTKIFLGMTLGTKLEARGPVMEKLSKLMFPSFRGGNFNNVQSQAELRGYEKKQVIFGQVFKGNFDLVKNKDAQEIAIAISNGAKLKDNIYFKDGRVLKLSDIKADNRDLYRSAIQISRGSDMFFKELYDDAASVGFKLAPEVKKYFRRIYDLKAVTENKEQFIEDVAQAIRKQSLRNVEKGTVKKATSLNAARKKAEGIFNNIKSNDFQQILDPKKMMAGKDFVKTFDLPLSDSLIKKRVITGDYDLVDGPLAKYFVNDVTSVLNDTINKSYKSIEFARIFGAKGERLNYLLKELDDQYRNSGFAKLMEGKNISAPHQDDLKHLAYSVNAMFGRHGSTVYNQQANTVAAWVSALTNMRLMGTVSLANLGDILQTFQNSTSFKSWVQGTYASFRTPKLPFTERGLPDMNKMSPADLMYIHQDQLLRKSLQRTGAGAFGPEQGVTPQALEWAQLSNEKFFKLVGLEDVTLFSRKYAFNVGAVDGLNIAKELAKMYTGSGKSFGQLFTERSFTGNKFRDLLKRAQSYNLLDVKGGVPTNFDEVIKHGSFKSYKEAMQDKLGVRYLQRTGQTVMNRDAIIPNVGNRMLFTQSKNPFIKLLGQFSSWAQAKSAQTNALLQRIEEGDAKLAFKMLAVIPIYTAVHQVRQYIKNGFNPTDTESAVDPLLDGWALTGNNGWLLNQTYSYLNYNSNRPLAIFPGYETVTALPNLGFDIFDTRTSLSQDMMEFFDDVAPTPEFRTIAADFAPDYLGFLDYQKYKEMNRADKTIESNKIFNVKGTGIR